MQAGVAAPKSLPEYVLDLAELWARFFPVGIVLALIGSEGLSLRLISSGLPEKASHQLINNPSAPSRPDYGNRHQFRLIVAPEDGIDYDDLKSLMRRLMKPMEEDLGTRLEWVAVDHFNIGHPHTHIPIRGKDDRDRDLVMPPSCIGTIRSRAADDLLPGVEKRIQLGISVYNWLSERNSRFGR